MCYVKNLRQDVRTIEEMNGLQQLPPIVLADIYLIVCVAFILNLKLIQFLFVCLSILCVCVFRPNMV